MRAPGEPRPTGWGSQPVGDRGDLMGLRQRLLGAFKQEREVDGLHPIPTEQAGDQHVFSATFKTIKTAAEALRY
jgi:hypothetical protein